MSQPIAWPIPFVDLPVTGTLVPDDYLLIDSTTAGTRRIVADRIQAETLKLKAPIALQVSDDITGDEMLEVSNGGRMKWLQGAANPKKVELVPDVPLEKLMIVGGLHITGDLTVLGSHPLSVQIAALEDRIAALEDVLRRQGHLSNPS